MYQQINYKICIKKHAIFQILLTMQKIKNNHRQYLAKLAIKSKKSLNTKTNTD